MTSSDRLRVAVGCDAAGFDYKERIKADLLCDDRIDDVIDVGVDAHADTDHPHIAVAAARLVAGGEADRAVLICGTGLGMAIAANKVHGVRAVTAHDSFSVEQAVVSSNAQVLTMGQRVVGVELARRLTREWIGYSFDESSPAAASVRTISSYETPR